MPSAWTTDVQQDEVNRLWIGTSRGLCIYDGKKWIDAFGELKGERIVDIEVVSSREVYVATKTALYRVEYYKKVIHEKGG